MNCLLCFEINKNYQNLIIFNSSEWLQLNIQYIIEKHLWKVENINYQSYVCQACWKELHNFHEFYLKVEKARAALNTVISKDVKSEYKKPNDISSDINSEFLSEPEMLFFKEENTLEIFEKEEEVEVKLKRSSKRIKSRKKNENKNINIAKKSSRKISKKGKSNNEIKELELDKKREEINNKLEQKNIENGAEENQMESDTNQQEIATESKLGQIENSTEENKIEEIPENQNDSLENNDDISPKAVDSSKLDQSWDEGDKFIAENFQITCTLCQTPLATYALMMQHYREKHKERGYASCCNRKLYPRIELIDHIKFHQNPEYFKCKYCNKILTKRICLTLHIKMVHGKINVECDICGKILANERCVKTHKLLHGADDSRILSCKQCDKTFYSKISLSRHIRVVHLKKNHRICELCGKSLSNIYIFKRHMLEHEGKARPTVSCEICGRVLSDIGCLKRHMTSHHPPKGVVTEFKCSECTKVFAVESNLKSHMRKVHDSKYARKCTLCDKILKGPCALTDHMSKHAGQPLRACGFCPKTFYSNGNMHAHRKRDHPLEWEKSVKEKFSGNLPEKYVAKTTGGQ